MTKSDLSSTESLDADDIAAASHELLEHLRRSGLRFVPTTNSESVERWSAQFAIDSVVDDPAEVDSTNQTPANPQRPVADSAADANVPSAAKPAASNTSQVVQAPANPATHRFAPVAPVRSSGDGYPEPALPIEEREAQFAQMQSIVAACTRCEQLASCRTNTVFGEGNISPRFVFLGEGPGADEDKTGRPFVGRAGQLLTKMIEACGLSRDEVYITNTVKCRPPNNRNPDPMEVGNCREYFEKQLTILRPEYIICLGAVSSQALLNTKLSIGRLRQTFHEYQDSKVLVIYHPAYLLRNPDAKKAAWADLQMLMKDAGLS